ncbi:MAG: hypothetical protein ACOCVM_03500 [Desulfovibrionaceae bacterium]
MHCQASAIHAADLDALDRRLIDSYQRGLPVCPRPFRTVAEAFRLIPDGGLPVIIPCDETAREHIRALRHAEHPAGFARRLQPYVVQVYQQDFSAMTAAGALEIVRDRFAVLLREDAYHPAFGLDVEGASSPLDPENLIL